MAQPPRRSRRGGAERDSDCDWLDRDRRGAPDRERDHRFSLLGYSVVFLAFYFAPLVVSAVSSADPRAPAGWIGDGRCRGGGRFSAPVLDWISRRDGESEASR
jgi:hypothetical protein